MITNYYSELISIIPKKSSKNLLETIRNVVSNKSKNQWAMYRYKKSFSEQLYFIPSFSFHSLYYTWDVLYQQEARCIKQIRNFSRAVAVREKKPRGWYYANDQSMGRAIKTRMTNDAEWHLCFTSFGIMMGIQCKNRSKPKVSSEE